MRLLLDFLTAILLFGDELRRAAELDLGVLSKEADTIAKLLGLLNILRGDDDHSTQPAGPNELPHCSLLYNVHAVRGCVEKYHFCVADQSDGQR